MSTAAASRIDLRIFWFLVAAAGIGLSVWVGVDSAAQVTDCEVVMPSHGITTWEQCWSPVHEVFGIWPVVGMAALCASPAALASIMLRNWVSWSVVVAYAALTVVGIVTHSPVLRSLVLAMPLAVIALIIATVQHRHS
ncbi:hypothetical protein [Gordonia sp. OPL2]|uniref:hypothetical protein n=1 Tax=Gordonia sp. OPL2 TaxID=2486274 RepID=UPI001654DCED|nr:hypothetical protein [Gordonia sp. OPL2]ROZ98790.1 hypothetical protein EEB19_14180 [Gordonia sp. OPL2]